MDYNKLGIKNQKKFENRLKFSKYFINFKKNLKNFVKS